MTGYGVMLWVIVTMLSVIVFYVSGKEVAWLYVAMLSCIFGLFCGIWVIVVNIKSLIIDFKKKKPNYVSEVK
jgi:hypothetical protein